MNLTFKEAKQYEKNLIKISKQNVYQQKSQILGLLPKEVAKTASIYFNDLSVCKFSAYCEPSISFSFLKVDA